MSISSQEHREKALETLKAVPCAIVTASDSRTPETDTSGQLIWRLLESQGHTVVAYHIVKDEVDQILQLLDDLTDDQSQARLILCNGGTGITPRDNTYDAISTRLEKVLPGFGEIFRMLSFTEIGAAAMLSRAIAGVYRGRLVFSMPGSPHAVELAMTKLILPEIHHLAWEVAGRLDPSKK